VACGNYLATFDSQQLATLHTFTQLLINCQPSPALVVTAITGTCQTTSQTQSHSSVTVYKVIDQVIADRFRLRTEVRDSGRQLKHLITCFVKALHCWSIHFRTLYDFFFLRGGLRPALRPYFIWCFI